jgi:hypothetical protein
MSGERSVTPSPGTLRSGEPRDTIESPVPDFGVATTPDDPYDAIGPGVEVPRVRTPQTGLELRVNLIIGYRETTGADIPPAILRAGWSMCALEHAGIVGGHVLPGGAIWCNNLGNISRLVKVHGRTWQGDHFPLRAHEDLASGPADVTQQLRAHSSAIAGAADYWDVLINVFPAAIAAMDRGDLDGLDAEAPGVALALKLRHYYSAPERQYAAGLVRWAQTFDTRFS